MTPCRILPLLLALLFCASCKSTPEPLMDPPSGLALGDPQGAESEELLYVTTRRPALSRAAHYGTHAGRHLRFGHATVRLHPEELELTETTEYAAVPAKTIAEVSPEDARKFRERISRALADAPSGDLLVYVHGTKVAFARPVERAAEFRHFGGRRFSTIAFDWPAHSNIIAYLLGPDRKHAEQAAKPLADFLEWLAEHEDVERIHLLGYSAGCETLMRGLAELHGRHKHLGHRDLQRRFRIANTIFASGDVETVAFLEHLPALHDLSARITVLLSDADNALAAAEKYMGGSVRLGDDQLEVTPELIQTIRAHPRLEIVDVSYGKEKRGFDIEGHHYWYRHPWVAADLLLLILTDRSADRRGLAPTPLPQVYHIPADHLARVRRVARSEGLPVSE